METKHKNSKKPNRFKELLDESGIKGTALARGMGVNYTQIAHWSGGDVEPWPCVMKWLEREAARRRKSGWPVERNPSRQDEKKSKKDKKTS